MDEFSGEKFFSTEMGKPPVLSYHGMDTGYALNGPNGEFKSTAGSRPKALRIQIGEFSGDKSSATEMGKSPSHTHHEEDTGYPQFGLVDKFRSTSAGNRPIASLIKMGEFSRDKSFSTEMRKSQIVSHHEADIGYTQFGLIDKFRSTSAENRQATAQKKMADFSEDASSTEMGKSLVLSSHEADTGHALNGDIDKFRSIYKTSQPTDSRKKMVECSGDISSSTEMENSPIFSCYKSETGHAFKGNVDKLRPTNASGPFAASQKKTDEFSGDKSSKEMEKSLIVSYHEAVTGHAQLRYVENVRSGYAENRQVVIRRKMGEFSGDKSSTEMGKSPILSYHEADTGYSLKGHVDKFRPTFSTSQPAAARKGKRSSKLGKKRLYSVDAMNTTSESLMLYRDVAKKFKATRDKRLGKKKADVAKDKKPKNI